MAFIDWSDSEEMFGLFVEYVSDERSVAEADPDRHQFLDELLIKLLALEKNFNTLSAHIAVESIRDIRAGLSNEFELDPVIEHFDDCVEELERIIDQVT